MAVDTFGLGELVVAIGGGRRAKEDRVDPRVGLVVTARIGDTVRKGERLAELHIAAEDDGARARAAACFEIGDAPASPPTLVLDRIGDAAPRG